MEYSKGKWQAGETFVYALNKSGINRFYLSVQAGKTDDDKRTPEAELSGNAQLIAAAVNACQSINPANPIAAAEALKDMYKALKEVDNLIKLARKFFPKSINNPDRFQLENTCAMIGKAIAKAEGK